VVWAGEEYFAFRERRWWAAAVVRVVFREVECLGGVAGVLSGLPKPPPGTALIARSTANKMTVANARMASRVNKFFNVLLG
jgi:hypothetical protein